MLATAQRCRKTAGSVPAAQNRWSLVSIKAFFFQAACCKHTLCTKRDTFTGCIVNMLMHVVKSELLARQTNSNILLLTKFQRVHLWGPVMEIFGSSDIILPMHLFIFKGSTNTQPPNAWWDFLHYDLLLNSNQIFWTSPSSAATRTLKYNKFRICWQASYFSAWSPIHLLGLCTFHQRWEPKAQWGSEPS